MSLRTRKIVAMAQNQSIMDNVVQNEHSDFNYSSLSGYESSSFHSSKISSDVRDTIENIEISSPEGNLRGHIY